jgi:uncharacterized protein YqeY
MSLRERIDGDIKSAMKAKDKIRLETVRSIKKLILEKEVEARANTGEASLTADQELQLLSQLAKQRRDAIEQYRKAGRDELADQEASELAIIEEYLPQQLTPEEVKAIVLEVIAAVGATSPKEMGKVMGPVMQRLKGQADGKLVQDLVKQSLSA